MDTDKNLNAYPTKQMCIQLPQLPINCILYIIHEKNNYYSKYLLFEYLFYFKKHHIMYNQ